MNRLRSWGLGVGMVLVTHAAFSAPVSGEAVEVASDIRHANGNTYDQVLLTGAVASIGADPRQATRISFRDLNDDIVQVEFSGQGTLTLSLANASGPAPADNYNQPGVLYVRGHASISVAGSDASTHLAVFSVGRLTAANASVLREGVSYDGFADIAVLAIQGKPDSASSVSTFGSILMGNVRFFALSGFTGIHAPNTEVQGPVTIGDISAFNAAIPVLSFGQHSRFGGLTVAGGDLFQTNGQAIQIKGFSLIEMMPGSDSRGAYLPAQLSRVRVTRDGSDVTQDVVSYRSALGAGVVAAVPISALPISGLQIFPITGGVPPVSTDSVPVIHAVVQVVVAPPTTPVPPSDGG